MLHIIYKANYANYIHTQSDRAGDLMRQRRRAKMLPFFIDHYQRIYKLRHDGLLLYMGNGAQSLSRVSGGGAARAEFFVGQSHQQHWVCPPSLASLRAVMYFARHVPRSATSSMWSKHIIFKSSLFSHLYLISHICWSRPNTLGEHEALMIRS